MTRSPCAATLVVLLLGSTTALGQPLTAPEPAALRGDSPQTRKRLAEAEQKLIAGKAADAVDDLQRILDESGDDLVTVDGKHYRPARWIAHQILGKLPPDAMKVYQARIDTAARKLLEASKRDRDPLPLRQLLERYYISLPAAEGLLLLGDLAFERGNFRAAELQWRRLLADPSADIPYPGPSTNPAAVQARIVLAAIFEGESDRARVELATLQAKYPAASGPFAGKTGPYAAALQGFIDRPPPLAAETDMGRSWPTFAGGPGRTGRSAPLPARWPPRPTWVADIPTDPPLNRAQPIIAPGLAPFGHPVIVDGRIYLTDGTRLMSFDLADGKRTMITALFPARVQPPLNFPEDIRSAPTPRPVATLSVAGGRVFARIGPPAVRPPESLKRGGKGSDEAAIVCYSPPLNPGRFAPPVRELWRILPPTTEDRGAAVWEGVPVVARGRMWAALARFEEGRVVHAIACFDPVDTDRAPTQPAWVVDVCDAPPSAGAEPRVRHELLTLAGPNVVLCTNTGVVVAVDATTGRRAWGFQYPRAVRRTAGAVRMAEPAPAVAANGRVFLAPVDANRVFAVDEETGQLLWESVPTEGAQILGVVRNKVIVTTTGPVRGIRALSAITGSYRGADAWNPAIAQGLTYGRGLVTDGLIVWPSEGGLYFLDPDTGSNRSPLRAILSGRRESFFGNVAYADGVLVIVTPTQVWGFKTDAPPVEAPPSSPDPRPRFEAAIDAAERNLANGQIPAARETLLATARSDYPPPWRAWAAARLLLLVPPVADPNDLPQDVRGALDPDLMGEWLLTAVGEFVSLRALVDRQTGRGSPPLKLPASPSLPHEPKREDVPGLSATASVTRTVPLPPTAFPLLPIPGAHTPPQHVFAATPREVVAVSIATGKRFDFSAPDLITHAADLPFGFVAAGPFVIAVYGAGHKPVWVFRIPETDPLPDRPGRITIRTGEAPTSPQLSSFRINGSSLFVRLGERHLLALDLEGRRVVWILGSHGRPGFEPCVFPTTPRFERNFLVTGRLVVVQLSTGKRWAIRADTGRVWNGDGAEFDGPVPAGFGVTTAQVPWVHPPVDVDLTRLAFSDGPGLVRLIAPANGRVKWTFEAEGEASLWGEPPQVRIWGEAMVVAVRRTHGVELDRIHLDDGKSVWGDGPIFVDASRVDLGAADADEDRLYILTDGKLFARNLDDGRAVWDITLPDSKGAGGWIVRAGRNAIVVYPAQAIPDQPFGEVWDRVVASFLRLPLGWRLPWLGATVYDAWNDRSVPVLLYDPESGRLLKEIRIPARGPGLTAAFVGEQAVIATGDRVVWIR